MSIAPVQSFPPAKSEPSDAGNVRPSQSPARPVPESVAEPARPVSAVLPKQEKAVPQSVPANYALPEDVVEVHQDPESKDQVIEYLDKSRNVVLQVPSSQELSVERGIAQELQHAARLRSTAETAAAESGGKTHGH